ncbi:MAG: hypothetical protein Tsb002_11500 [Wenzhouxiangellaceae bacterium]
MNRHPGQQSRLILSTRIALGAKMSLLFVCLLASVAVAQQEAAPTQPCSDPAYRAFDFWLGEWDVYANDQLAGHNRIESILNGCALSENWSSVRGGRGNSYNAYDATTGNWNQFWVDVNGLILRLVGQPEAGSMVMAGLVPVSDEPGVTTHHQIRWTPTDAGHVRQLWQSRRSDQEEWATVFDGLYVPKGSPPPAAVSNDDDSE